MRRCRPLASKTQTRLPSADATAWSPKAVSGRISSTTRMPLPSKTYGCPDPATLRSPAPGSPQRSVAPFLIGDVGGSELRATGFAVAHRPHDDPVRPDVDHAVPVVDARRARRPRRPDRRRGPGGRGTEHPPGARRTRPGPGCRSSTFPPTGGPCRRSRSRGWRDSGRPGAGRRWAAPRARSRWRRGSRSAGRPGVGSTWPLAPPATVEIVPDVSILRTRPWFPLVAACPSTKYSEPSGAGARLSGRPIGASTAGPPSPRQSVTPAGHALVAAPASFTSRPSVVISQMRLPWLSEPKYCAERHDHAPVRPRDDVLDMPEVALRGRTAVASDRLEGVGELQTGDRASSCRWTSGRSVGR